MEKGTVKGDKDKGNGKGVIETKEKAKQRAVLNRVTQATWSNFIPDCRKVFRMREGDYLQEYRIDQENGIRRLSKTWTCSTPEHQIL